MTDKKLTDNEIIKALDESELFLQKRVKDGQPIKLNECDIGILRNISQVCAKAYDEINRQKTENENLKVENQSLRSAANSLKMHYEEAQAEVERLKRELDLVIENSISARYPHCVLCGNGAILTKSLEEYDELIADISAEAYKEFAEKLENICEEIMAQEWNEKTAPISWSYAYAGFIDDIDNLLKEMVGEEE